MNKGLYKDSDISLIFWYKTWENSRKNFGASIDFEDPDFWTWENCGHNDTCYLVGAACLAQW